MAGYKTTIKSLDPKLFITFDGDAFDSTRRYTAVPAVILDESSFENHGTLINSSNTYPGYRAGVPSLIDLEKFDQYGCSFGFYGKAPTGDYPKAYVTVPHSDSLSFVENNGALSVVFSIRKEENENTYRQNVNPDGSYNTAVLIRPIINKVGVFKIQHNYQYGTGDFLEIECPGSKSFTYSIPGDYHAADNHMVLTWTLDIAETGERQGTARLYLNGMVVAEQTFNYYDTWPNMNIPSPVNIGGSVNAESDNNDRNTSSTTIDQVAIYGKALSADQVARLYRKTVTYKTMILRTRPYAYWPMEDIEDPNEYTCANLVSGVVARCVGGASRILRNQTGPSQIPASRSIQFSNSGQLHITNGGGPVVNIGGDYSIEFWFSATSNSIATIFSMSGTEQPFNGISLTLNMHNNQYSGGGLQIQETETEFGSVTGNYNNGTLRHVVIAKRGNYLELWVDNIRVVNKLVTHNNPGSPGTAVMFSQSPGRIASNGSVSNLALYNFALQPQQIMGRATYQKVFKIRGTVTLRGAPYRANVRLYAHDTGRLVQEIISNTSDGNYNAELYDNRTIDIVVMNAQDPNVRYRVYGPVTPSEYLDSST